MPPLINASWTTRLLGRRLVAAETLECQLERPAGFTFTPGQYIELTLVDSPASDGMGDTRMLSIASAPHEPTLTIVMRLRASSFKQALATMPLGSPLHLVGPDDDFHVPFDGARPLVFVAGGVGIAPFRAVIRHALAVGARLPATLIYANRRPEDAAYLDELRDAETRLPGLRVIPTMTRAAASAPSWTGETTRPTIDGIARMLGGPIVGPRYYVVGSDTLIASLRHALEQAGVAPADIAIEMYPYY